MDKIKIAITGRVASVVALPEVVADNAEYEVDFALDPREGWDMALPITALFVRRDGSYTPRIMDAGATSCTMPPQTGTNIVFVGLTQDDMRTTTPATIKVHRSIRTVANDPLPAPSEDVYAQILAAYAGIKILSGKGAPTSATQGKVNQLYRDEDTQKLYICTSTDGGYTWAEVSGGGSGGSVDIDATLTKEGQAADAKAAGDAIGKKIDKAQGTGNAGKILGIGADGNVTPQDKPVQSLAGASAPTAATAGVVGQEYYVIVGNAVTEMYVCTAVANGTYTWGKTEFGAEIDDTSTEPTKVWSAEKCNQLSDEITGKLNKSGWTPDKYIGTDAEGNLIEKDAPAGGGGWTIDELTAETEIADDDTLPYYDTSAKGQRKTLWSNIKAVLKTYFDSVYMKLSGGTLTGKIVLPTDDQTAGFTNSGDIKIFGYGNIGSISHLRIGDSTRPVQLCGSAEHPKYNDDELVLKTEFDTALGSYITDINTLIGGDA